MYVVVLKKVLIFCSLLVWLTMAMQARSAAKMISIRIWMMVALHRREGRWCPHCYSGWRASTWGWSRWSERWRRRITVPASFLIMVVNNLLLNYHLFPPIYNFNIMKRGLALTKAAEWDLSDNKLTYMMNSLFLGTFKSNTLTNEPGHAHSFITKNVKNNSIIKT